MYTNHLRSLAKIVLTFTVGVVSVVSISRCSGQNEPYNSIPQVSLSGAGCLNAAPTALEAFFNGASTAPQISGMWNCLSYSVRMFSTYVEGQNKSEYTGDELREFLESYFLQDQKPQPGQTHVITDNFLMEILEIKRVFLGGTNTVLKRTEIESAYGLFNNFNGVSLTLLPHSNLLFGDKSKLGVPISDDADQAVDAFSGASRTLAQLLNANQTSYLFSDLSLFLHELYLYIRNSNPQSTFKDYSTYVPLLAQLKGLLMNSDRSKIQSPEWLALGPYLSQTYAIFLRASFYLNGASLLAVDPLSEIRALMLDFTQVLRQGIAQRKGDPLPLTDVDAVIDAAAALGFLPSTISDDDAKNLVGRLVDYILNPQNIYPQSGISTQKLNYVETEIDDWATVQKALVMKIDLPGNSTWAQMTSVIDGPWPLRQDSIGRVILDGNTKVAPNIDSNSRLNWARALVQILYRAYILDPVRRKNLQMIPSELHTAFLDLKPALVAFGLVDADDTTFDTSLFREANLFMPRSNGDFYLSFYELIEYVHLIFGGIDAGHQLVSAMPTSCAVTPASTDVTCWRTDFRQFYKSTLSYMPLQADYLSSFQDKNWNNYIKYLEIVNRPEGPAATPITNTAIYESFVLLQYIEVLMLRYDTEHTGKIGIIGCFKMLDLFVDTIAAALGLDPVADRPEIEVFWTFMLHYGAPPDPKDPISQLRYENWKLKRGKWELGVDRSNILDVMAILTKLGL
jgi:hypothetical protein